MVYRVEYAAVLPHQQPLLWVRAAEVLRATALFYLNEGQAQELVWRRVCEKPNALGENMGERWSAGGWQEEHGGELRLYPYPLPPVRPASGIY